jgi:hypothetical protein
MSLFLLSGLGLEVAAIIVLVVSVKLFLMWYMSPTQKGLRGERAVARRLKDYLPADKYIVLNDLYFNLPDGSTTQVDHLVVSQFGVFVIETKTYSGWIFGDEKSAKWSQSIYRKKSSFQNPLRQNYRHICTLADTLNIDKHYFHNVVVFRGGCSFKTEPPAGVVFEQELIKYLLSHTTSIIKPSQVQEVAEVIMAWAQTVSEQSKKSHVSNLKKRHTGVQVDEGAPKCPICGGEMVLRQSKKSNSAFYGCKAYPKCRGKVQVKM